MPSSFMFVILYKSVAEGDACVTGSFYYEAVGVNVIATALAGFTGRTVS